MFRQTSAEQGKNFKMACMSMLFFELYWKSFMRMAGEGCNVIYGNVGEFVKKLEMRWEVLRCKVAV